MANEPSAKRPRTTAQDLDLFVAALRGHVARDGMHLRIGQIIGNAVGDPYYVENADLIEALTVRAPPKAPHE